MCAVCRTGGHEEKSELGQGTGEGQGPEGRTREKRETAAHAGSQRVRHSCRAGVDIQQNRRYVPSI